MFPPLTNNEPVNWEPLANDITLNPSAGDTDAVTDPDLISVAVSASSFNAERGIFNKPAPLPLKNEPVATLINPPVTNSEPVNWEPLANDSTLNPVPGDTDAVTLPLVILNNSCESAENGIFVNPAPLPLNTEADTEP